MKHACEIMVGKPEGKRPLGKSRRRWEDNIEMDLRDSEWALVNTVMNRRLP
jgi:hypothetical protein